VEIEIRKGRAEDMSSVLVLIKELADFEKAPQEVEVNTSQMLEWFENEKIFNFFVAEKNQEIIGIALYYYKYSTWKGKCIFLEDIIVTDKERKKGIGKKLFNEVIKVAKLEKVKRLEWIVLDWNENAIEFYKKYNSIFDNEWICCKLNYQQLQGFEESLV
jgi:GNAT superfamily N-acetyltransferase